MRNSYPTPGRQSAVVRQGLRLLVMLAVLATTLSLGAEPSDAAVTYEKVNGHLRITGDGNNNRIELQKLAGRYRLTIDGRSRILTNISSVEVDARGGNDTVLISDAVLSGDLEVDLGSGRDRLDVRRGRLDRNLLVDGRAGNEYLQLQDAIVKGRSQFRLRAGEGFIQVNGGTFHDPVTATAAADGEIHYRGYRAVFHSQILVTGSNQDDTVVFSDAQVLAGANLNLGSGNDGFVTGFDSVVRDLRVDLGPGENFAHLTYSRFTGRTEVIGGGEIDYITVMRAEAARLEVRGNAGEDQIEARRSVLDRLDLHMGQGHDGVVFDRVVLAGPAALNGGGGIDAYHGNEVTVTGSLSITGFEV